MTSTATKEENMPASDPAPIYDNVKSMADFVAREIGRELARCAQLSHGLWGDVYVNQCFRSYGDLMEFVSYHIVCCYLDAVLLAIKGTDDENKDDRVSAYILKHAKEWFNACVQG